VFSRSRLDTEVVFGATTAASTENRVSLRSTGSYHRLKLVPTGASWTHAVAIDVDITPIGTR
jgi:hypothetical protein